MPWRGQGLRVVFTCGLGGVWRCCICWGTKDGTGEGECSCTSVRGGARVAWRRMACRGLAQGWGNRKGCGRGWWRDGLEGVGGLGGGGGCMWAEERKCGDAQLVSGKPSKALVTEVPYRYAWAGHFITQHATGYRTQQEPHVQCHYTIACTEHHHRHVHVHQGQAPLQQRHGFVF